MTVTGGLVKRAFSQKLVFASGMVLSMGTAPLRPVKPAMIQPPARLSKEERLAAKLRENLHRRKAQSRTIDSREIDASDAEANPALPKAPPKS